MKWTKTLILMLREALSDAETVSHKLLLRAGLIRKLAGGVYTFLPWVSRVLKEGGADHPGRNGSRRCHRKK